MTPTHRRVTAGLILFIAGCRSGRVEDSVPVLAQPASAANTDSIFAASRGALKAATAAVLRVDSPVLAAAHEQLIKGETSVMQIRLGPMGELRMNLQETENIGAGVESYRGEIAGVPGSRVLLTRVGTTIVGSIRKGDTTFRIRQLSPELSVIERLDSLTLPRELPPRVPPRAPPPDGPSMQHDQPDPICPPSVVQMLLLIPANDATRMGGEATARGLAGHAVTLTNEVIRNTGRSDTVRLAAVDIIDYAVLPSLEGNLDSIYAHKSIRARRDAVGADVVAMIIKDKLNGCGISWRLDDPRRQANYAYAVVPEECVSPNSWSLAHEVGHTFGMDHDYANSDPDPPARHVYPFAFGYQDTQQEFRDVMAYECAIRHCERVPYYSNPSIMYARPPGTLPPRPLGIAMTPGVPRGADNFGTLSRTACIVSKFRP